MQTLSEKSSIHAQVAVLESCWYMRNQLLRDTDWSSMAHSLEVRVPFVDFVLLKRLAPAIASPLPPTKQDLAASARLPKSVVSRLKTGFTTPVRKWIEVSKPASQRWLRDGPVKCTDCGERLMKNLSERCLCLGGLQIFLPGATPRTSRLSHCC